MELIIKNERKKKGKVIFDMLCKDIDVENDKDFIVIWKNIKKQRQVILSAIEDAEKSKQIKENFEKSEKQEN